MKDTLQYLATQIVDHPDDVSVTETTDNEKTTLTLKVNSEDMGKIIGKQGRIIRALRDLIKIIATKRNSYVNIVLAE